MKKIFLSFIVLLTGCIGTDVVPDFVEAQIVIQNPIVNLQVGDTFMLNATYLDNTGQPVNEVINWVSSDENVITVSQEGLLEGISEGIGTITAQSGEVTASVEIMVSMAATELMNQRLAMIQTTSSYPLSGTAVLRIDEEVSQLDLLDDFSTTDDLPGLYIYLTNNPSTIDNALELGPVEQISGAQTYDVPEDVELFTYNYVLFYCKPFLVKVGDAELEE